MEIYEGVLGDLPPPATQRFPKEEMQLLFMAPARWHFCKIWAPFYGQEWTFWLQNARLYINFHYGRVIKENMSQRVFMKKSAHITSCPSVIFKTNSTFKKWNWCHWCSYCFAASVSISRSIDKNDKKYKQQAFPYSNTEIIFKLNVLNLENV